MAQMQSADGAVSFDSEADADADAKLKELNAQYKVFIATISAIPNPDPSPFSAYQKSLIEKHTEQINAVGIPLPAAHLLLKLHSYAPSAIFGGDTIEIHRPFLMDFLRKKWASEDDLAMQQAHILQKCAACFLAAMVEAKGVDKIGSPKRRFSLSNSFLIAQMERKFKTQKAKGVKALASTDMVPPVFWGFKDPHEIDQIPAEAFPRFARPCPKTPRHGFVESRVVENGEAAKAVFAEALKADPEAELLLMEPMLPAECSMVITPGSATVGAANDGATAGRTCSTIPLLSLRRLTETEAEAGIKEAPYYEVVCKDETAPRFVQLRNGPMLAHQGDWFPRDMRIASIIRAEGDLVEFEKTIKEAPEGAVLSHVGGSLTSHYAVHAILKGMPIFLTHEPEIGGEIAKNVDTPRGHDFEAIREGIRDGLVVSLETRLYRHADIHTLLLATHHAPAMTDALGGWVIGYGIAMMLRYGLIAAHGEARHSDRNQRRSRHEIYAEYADQFMTALIKAHEIQRLFVLHPWQGGVGGPKWANCLSMTLALDKAARRFYTAPSTETFKEMLTALHTVVNCAHNNGWWLNKFVPSRAFDMHVEAHPMAIAEAARAIFRLREISTRGTGAGIADKWAALTYRSFEQDLKLRVTCGTKLYADMVIESGPLRKDCTLDLLLVTAGKVDSFHEWFKTLPGEGFTREVDLNGALPEWFVAFLSKFGITANAPSNPAAPGEGN